MRARNSGSGRLSYTTSRTAPRKLIFGFDAGPSTYRSAETRPSSGDTVCARSARSQSCVFRIASVTLVEPAVSTAASTCRRASLPAASSASESIISLPFDHEARHGYGLAHCDERSTSAVLSTRAA